jgi:cytochrome c oxidase subunit 4
MTEGTLERVEHASAPIPVETGAAHAADSHGHPNPFQYVMVGLVLVVLTAIEVGLSYLEGEVSNAILVTLLIVFMIVKFGLVALYFMHLKHDTAMFRRFFVLGIGAAIVLYAVVLASLAAF